MTLHSRPYLGNIETSRSENPIKLLNAKIVMISRGRRYELMSFHDGHFRISPVKWLPKHKEYSYESLSGMHIEKVSRWEPYWYIQMDYTGRERWLNLMNVIYHMTGNSHAFTESGIYYSLRFLFYPPGDPSRTGIGVIMPADKIEPEFIGNRYAGYTNFRVIIKGDGSYHFDRPILPRTSRLIGITKYGSLLTDSHIRTPELIISD